MIHLRMMLDGQAARLSDPLFSNCLKISVLNRLQIIVVYKIDRLTRSLTDFAKTVEIFDAHKVTFVSVT